VIFLQPLLLALGVLIGIPFIIHLLGERKHQTLSFSSLKFLREIEQDSLQKLQLRQWLILLSRALWIGMLVLALAQPFISKGSGYLEPGILVIDKSYSTRIDKNFLNIEKSLIENFPRWDIITYNERTISDSLGTELSENIETNKRIAPNIILFSDFQQNEQNKEIIEIIGSQSKKFHGLSLKKNKENLAISKLHLIEENNNPNDMKKLEIHLSQNDQTLISPAVYINLNGTQVGRAAINKDGYGYFYFSVPDNDNIPCIVTCPDDEYPEDNTRYLVIKNKVQIKILCVNDNTESGYHIKALRAMEQIALTVITPQKLTSVDLNDFDMIWFSNLYALNPAMMKEIMTYAHDNPLLVTCGSNITYPTGWEAISGDLRQVKNENAFFRVENIPGIALNEDLLIKQYYQSSKQYKQIIWELATGDPLLTEVENNIYLLLSPFHFEWNEMGLSPYFTRVISRLIEKVLDVQELSYETGETIPIKELFSKVITPTGEQHQINGEFKNTMTPGFYSIESANSKTVVAVNIPENECVQTELKDNNITMLEWDEKTISNIEEQIKGRNSQTIFYILALLFIIFEMALLQKGERTK